METGLQGKVVLVTGASGGIGGACARAFAAEGARLALHANSNPDATAKLAKEIPAESIEVQADLTDEGQVALTFAAIIERFGRVDVLVANAGIWPAEFTPVHRMSLARWNEVTAANQTSVFLCAREFFRALEADPPANASMVIVGSTAGMFGEEGHAEYAASKAAIVHGLVKSLKNEIARIVPAGRVNAVCPGWTLTPMAEPGMKDKDAVARVLQTRPIRRIARPEDVAYPIVFLASDRLAGHISGEILTVSGGMEGRLLHDREDVDPNQA